jgi:hypothetical protein
MLNSFFHHSGTCAGDQLSPSNLLLTAGGQGSCARSVTGWLSNTDDELMQHVAEHT